MQNSRLLKKLKYDVIVMNLPSDIILYIYKYIGSSTSTLIHQYWETHLPSFINWDKYEKNLEGYRKYKEWCYRIYATPIPLCKTSIMSNTVTFK